MQVAAAVLPQQASGLLFARIIGNLNTDREVALLQFVLDVPEVFSLGPKFCTRRMTRPTGPCRVPSASINSRPR